MENVKVELSNGYAMVNPKINRKTDKAYKKLLFANSKVDERGKTIVSMSDSFDATDILVLNQVVELNIDSKDVAIDSDNFDAMDADDYDKISAVILDLKTKKEVEKKS